jgi:hypothetical protein
MIQITVHLWLLGLWIWAIVRYSAEHDVLETGSVSSVRKVVFSEYQTMNEVQKATNPECYTPSLELFRIYLRYTSPS